MTQADFVQAKSIERDMQLLHESNQNLLKFLAIDGLEGRVMLVRPQRDSEHDDPPAILLSGKAVMSLVKALVDANMVKLFQLEKRFEELGSNG